MSFFPYAKHRGQRKQEVPVPSSIKKELLHSSLLILYHECMSEIKTILLAFEDTLG